MSENTITTQEVDTNIELDIDKIKMFGVEGGVNNPNARRITSLDEMNCTNMVENSDNTDDTEPVIECSNSDDILLNENLQKNITNENVIYEDIETPIISSTPTNIQNESVNGGEEKGINEMNRKTHIFVDTITLNIQVELTQDEINCGILPCHRGFSVGVDNSIYLLLNLIISEENDFRIHFTKDAKIIGNYSQIVPNESSGNSGKSRGKLEIAIHQDESAEQELIPSKVKVFELLLGDSEVNYYLNNFYEYVKGQKSFLEKEVSYYEDFIYEKLLESKEILQNSHKMNTAKIMKILEKLNEEVIGERLEEPKKIDSKKDIEAQKRWKERFEKGVKHITTGNDGNYIHEFIYKNQGFELQLLADILKMEISSLRRLIKRLEKKTGKKYIFPNKKGTRIVDNTKGKVISKKEIEEVYSKSIGFVTFEGFFEVLGYVGSL